MEDFILQSWEVLEDGHNSPDFVPLQVEVFGERKKTEGLLEESFDIPITYAKGSRTHRSTEEVRSEQQHLMQEQEDLANSVILPKEELEQKLAEAYETGRKEASQEEAEKFNQRLKQAEKSLNTFMQDLAQQDKSRSEEIKDSALEISLQIAKKIIDGAVEINPEYILQVLKEALHLSGGASIKKIRVSPQDLEFIELFKISESLKEFDGSWEFEADETVKAGCILESSAGTVDYQLDKAWDRIKDKVLSLRKT